MRKIIGKGMQEIETCLMQYAGSGRAYSLFRINIPGFLLDMQSGNGQTFITEYVTEVMKVNWLRAFDGTDDYLEYRLDGSYDQFQKTRQDIRKRRVYANTFHGVIALEVTDFAMNMNQPQMQELMTFLDEISGEVTLLLFVDTGKSVRAKELYSRLHETLPELIRVKVGPYSEQELAEMILEEVLQQGVRVEDEEAFIDRAMEMISRRKVKLAREIKGVTDRMMLLADYSSFRPVITGDALKRTLYVVKGV